MQQHLPVVCSTARALLEGWRTIPSHPKYQAHFDGRIRNAKTGRVLAPQPSRVRNGEAHYLKVCLGRAVQVGVHILVCEAWHGTKPTGLPQVVDHVDNHGMRNPATNLRWASYAMNTRQWYAVQSRFQAAGEQYGWTREEVYPEQEWAAEADRLAQAGL